MLSKAASRLKLKNQLADRFEFSSSLWLKSILKQMNAEAFLFYDKVGDEVSIEPLFLIAQEQNIATFFSRIDGDILDFRKVAHLSDLKPARFSREPATSAEPWTPVLKTVSFTPGQFFSFSGARLGRGKGHYDRFFAKHPQITRVGVASPERVGLTSWPVDAWDCPMQALLTPISYTPLCTPD